MSETKKTPTETLKVTLLYLRWNETETIDEEMTLAEAVEAYSYFLKSDAYLVGFEVI